MEDSHFLIDSSPPKELTYTLLSFTQDVLLTTSDLIVKLTTNWDFQPQRNFSNTTRRLIDLRLITKQSKNTFKLSDLGKKLKDIHEFDNSIFFDILHYLHNTYFYNNNARMLFWSYRKCSELLWTSKKISSNKNYSSVIVNEINHGFPDMLNTSSGGRFNEGGVASWRAWLNSLDPNPIGSDGNLIHRNVNRYEFFLLSLDDFYRRHQLRYGDPVVLSDKVLDEISSVFFLNPDCTKQLITIATKLSPLLSVRDTFAGMAISLKEPYSIERL